MDWPEDHLKEVVLDLGEAEALWLLEMAVGKRITSNNAHNYKVFPGSIKSRAKSLGLNPPQDDEIRRAFQRLKRTKVFYPPSKSQDSIIEGDKPDYIKATERVGDTLLRCLRGSASLRQWIEAEVLGAKREEDERWFPGHDVPLEGAEVQMWTTDPRPDGQEFEIDVTAEFNCRHPDCDETVHHEYSLHHPQETWTRWVEVDCPGCGQRWAHLAGDPYRDLQTRHQD